MLATLVKVLNHHTNKHVEDEEADNEEEGDEIQQHPRVVVGHRLELKAAVLFIMYEKEVRKKTQMKGKKKG